MTVGEVGDGARSLKTVAAYTADNDKLNMCYTFDLLGPDFTASHIRGAVDGFQKAVTDGWVCWAFSNHDVIRHLTRFAENVEEQTRVAKLAICVLASLRGSICLYQGEELALTEADLAFEDLRDPYGIRFWPAFKGRDGCRTPMVWETGKPHAGFTTAEKPWLPVPYVHAMLAADGQERKPDSVLNHYKAMLAFRRSHSCLRDGAMEFLETNQDVLVFTRHKNGERLLFVFNLTRQPVDFRLPPELRLIEHLGLPGFEPTFHNDSVKLEPLDAFCGRVEKV